MSTERSSSRRGRSRRRRLRLFLAGFGIAILTLAIVGAAGAAVSAMQGPRTTDVQVDPAAAVSSSGSRLILTTNQSLQTVRPEQVTVTPAAPFTVDTSGRSIGIRFTLPLYDATQYTVQIANVTGVGGGPASTLSETFQTPDLEVFLLQRATDGDTIFRTGLAGTAAVPVFRDAHIEDFRATSGHLVISLRHDNVPELVVTDRDGQNRRDLPLPGTGNVSGLESADRGETIGFVYSDRDPATGAGADSVLYTVSLSDPTAQPVAVQPAGADARVAQWRFVPDTDRVLIANFAGRLLLTAPGGTTATDLGTAAAIEGIARGSQLAIIERIDGMVVVNLADGSTTPLPVATGVPGSEGILTPLPGSANEALRPFAVVTGGVAQGTTVYRVSADGTTSKPVFTIAASAAFLQTCISPNGRYGAFLLAPDIVSNPYDTYLRPLPGRVETHIVDLDTGQEVVALAGSDISWCQAATQ
ncbi:hypothetical protein ABCS02_13230 [Microbacterium sp. X-17]|uniref:hypothetical protein n=1 Tax=Microbacterium sp. X-17 TaxID=3144404 RepID=UPI0031F4AD82